MCVGFSRGSREGGLKTALKPYHAVGNDGKRIQTLVFCKYVKKKVIVKN